jgi:hypothetical protein
VEDDSEIAVKSVDGTVYRTALRNNTGQLQLVIHAVSVPHTVLDGESETDLPRSPRPYEYIVVYAC